MPYEIQYSNYRPYEDHRKYGASFYVNLQLLCSLVNNTVRNSLKRFYSTQMISLNVLSREKFLVEFSQILEELRRQASRDALRTLHLIRGVWYGNQYISGYFTNWKFEIRPDYNSTLTPIPTRPVFINGNCSCATSSNCFERTFFRDLYTNELFIVPGMFVGCKPF